MSSGVSFLKFLWTGSIEPRLEKCKVEVTKTTTAPQIIREISSSTYTRDDYSLKDFGQLTSIAKNFQEIKLEAKADIPLLSFTIHDQVKIEIPNPTYYTKKYLEITSQVSWFLAIDTIFIGAVTFFSIMTMTKSKSSFWPSRLNISLQLSCALTALAGTVFLLIMARLKTVVRVSKLLCTLGDKDIINYIDTIQENRSKFYSGGKVSPWELYCSSSEKMIVNLVREANNCEKNVIGGGKALLTAVVDFLKIQMDETCSLMIHRKEMQKFLETVVPVQWKSDVVNQLIAALELLKPPAIQSIKNELNGVANYNLNKCLELLDDGSIKEIQMMLLTYVKGQTARKAVELPTDNLGKFQEQIKTNILQQLLTILNRYTIPYNEIPPENVFWTTSQARDKWVPSDKK